MWWFPWGSYLAFTAMIVVLVAMAFTPALERDLGFSVATLIIAVLAYVGWRRRLPAPAILRTS